MKVLRLGNSNDFDDAIPQAERAYTVASNVLGEHAGEPVETVVRRIWPTKELPGLVDRWLDEHDPDLVFLKLTWFWYGYESLPLRIERLLGRAGKPVANAGTRASENRRVSHNAAFKFGRRMARKYIGGDSPFTTDHVIATIEDAMRRITARETVALVVKGTGAGERAEDSATDGYFDRFTKRRLYVEGTIQRICHEMGAFYTDTGPRKTDEQRDMKDSDGLHPGATGQYWMGRQEGDAMVAGWEAFKRGPVRAARSQSPVGQ